MEKAIHWAEGRVFLATDDEFANGRFSLRAAKAVSCAAKISPVTTSATTAAPPRPPLHRVLSSAARNSSFLVVFRLVSSPAGRAKSSKAKAHDLLSVSTLSADGNAERSVCRRGFSKIIRPVHRAS
jgi:hypothetical protein